MSGVDLETAVATMARVAPPPVAVHLPLAEALGRTLAEDLVARADHPGVDVAAMDGYACRLIDAQAADSEASDGQASDGQAPDAQAADGRTVARLRVVGASYAGSPFAGEVGPGEAVAIATGAAIPEGADAIVVVEATERHGDEVVLREPATPRHVRKRGEDLQRGVSALPAGGVLDAPRIGLAAALGHDRVAVARKPGIAVLVTGGEVASTHGELRPGDVFDSNGPLITALVRALGAEPIDLGRVEDDPGALRSALDRASGADLIVTTGGASVGRYDLVRKGMGSAAERFESIRVRPGGPALLGEHAGTPWLGLPGTPVAVAVVGTVLLSAWAHAALGRAGPSPFARREVAICDGPVRGVPSKSALWLAKTWTDADGRRRVAMLPRQGSSRIEALARADALVVVPPGPTLEPGSLAEVLPFAAPWPSPGGVAADASDRA
ncbi:MAG: molybdopterin molybdotransferase MoeA [Trueperaceae bacterium]|nr:molybdopterin molybdotransferase MoeA [Trueperaceae bacterium]